MKLSNKISKHNYRAFLFHAIFLAFAQSFIDIDTVIPSMIVEAGGNAIHIGIMTAIMFGGSSFTQLFFAPILSNYPYKKWSLLLGINSRIVSLFVLGVILIYSTSFSGTYLVWILLSVLTIFALGGAFANISYTDILGKSIISSSRKKFFSLKQVLSGVIVLISSLLVRKILISAKYPNNYSYMYFIAFIALLIASIGFWKIQETVQSKMQVKGVGDFLKIVSKELKNNKQLKYFLGFINTMGVSVTLLPFIMLYAKEHFNAQTADTGIFLIFKILGSVLMGVVLYRIAGRFRYKYLLYSNILLVLSIPTMMIFSKLIPPFLAIFFIGGIIYSIYRITISGILLEISNDTNRALYTGIAGAGSIIPAIFPLIGGKIINEYGYNIFLVLFAIIIFCSIFFIYKLNCKK